MEKKKNEFIYFAFRNVKFLIGFTVFMILIIGSVVGLMIYSGDPTEIIGSPYEAPSAEFPFGTTSIGEDVAAQIVHGTKNSLIVGFVAGFIGCFLGLLTGFFAGYLGGLVDDFLMMLTNIFLVIPTIAILIVLAAYLPYRGIFIQCILIGCTSWPWVARAVRSQALSLRNRQFIDLARISGVSTLRIVFFELAPNMLSYVVMAFIIQISGAIMIAATLDFIGLGPSKGISLGLMMNYASGANAMELGSTWWFFPPGLIITLLVGSLYFMNTGLDEVFNPKLRKL